MKENDKGYTYEIIVEDIAVAEAERRRDVARFEALCRECPLYASRWCCPPLGGSELSAPSRYTSLRLTGVKIVPGDSRYISEVRALTEPGILEEERRLGGYAALFTGQCRHCQGQECTRPTGGECRHPELVRPSLEALGYNVGALAEDFLGHRLLWSADGEMPEYLLLVAGVFY